MTNLSCSVYNEHHYLLKNLVYATTEGGGMIGHRRTHLEWNTTKFPQGSKYRSEEGHCIPKEVEKSKNT